MILALFAFSISAGAVMWLSSGHMLEVISTANAWRVAGDPLFGLNMTEPRASIFVLAYETSEGIRIVDHGKTVTPSMVALYNFISRGQVRTVADALRLMRIPLTARQARLLPLCATLAEFPPRWHIVVQPDPWQRGIASWYGPGFQGQLAASGEIYDMYTLTAAHRTLPLGSSVRVISQRTGESVVVRINDRGPFISNRIIDLSYAAMATLGYDGGLASVYLERLDPTALENPCPWQGPRSVH